MTNEGLTPTARVVATVPICHKWPLILSHCVAPTPQTTQKWTHTADPPAWLRMARPWEPMQWVTVETKDLGHSRLQRHVQHRTALPVGTYL